MSYLFSTPARWLALSLILFGPAMAGCEKEEPEIAGRTEHFKISSAHVKDDYDIFVYIPASYRQEGKENQLIIGLDGDFRFKEISEIVSAKSEEGTMPPCIFVGIGNSENRNRDYTPTAFKHGEGGAQNFYQFLTNELVPELEMRYQIDPANTKTLIGNSFGGLFTHFAMFQNRATSPFNKFISVGCSYWFDSGVIFEYEQQYAESHRDLPVKFFNGMGTLEGGVSLGSFAEMNERLKSRGYAGFESDSLLIKKHGHSGAAITGFKKGLDYVFNN